MEHMERLLPLAILAALAMFVMILIRRGWREHANSRPLVSATAPRPEVKAVVESAPASMQPTNQPTSVTPAAVVCEQPTRTPVHQVLALLQEKDAVAMGFVLSEILGPPVSRRR